VKPIKTFFRAWGPALLFATALMATGGALLYRTAVTVADASLPVLTTIW